MDLESRLGLQSINHQTRH